MEPIKIDVKVNTKEIKEAQREIQKFANDTWKALDAYTQAKEQMVKVNAKEIKQAQREIQKFANDTWKALDPNKVKKLEDERGRLLAKKRDAQTALNNIRKLYDAWIVDNKQLAQAELAFGKISKATTEAARQMTNYKNTGDTTVSRLQAKFNSLGGWILKSLVNPMTIAISSIYALGRAIVNGTKTARSFETAFVWVQKTFDDTAEWYDILEKWLRKLSRQFPLTFEELAWIAEVAWQLWVRWRDNLIKFTEVAAWLGIATNLSAEEAATSLKRFSDVLWVPITEIENLWSALVWLGNNFAANEQEILGFAKQAQTAWLLSNLTATEILWISTALVASWINAEAWGTAIVKFFWRINDAAAKWWVELQKLATVAWMTAEEFKWLVQNNTWEAFVKVLEWIRSAWTDAGRILDELWITEDRLRKTILAGSWNFKTLAEAIKKAGEEYKNNNALQEEVNKRLASTDWRLQISKNKWRDVSASIWAWFNKVRVPVFEWITKLLENFVLNTKVSFQFIKNIFYNMDIAAQHLAAWIVNWFQKARNWVTDFVNWIIKTYNKLASQLWLKELSIINTKELNLVEKKWFKSLTEWIQKITDEYDYNKKQQLKLAEGSIKKEIELQTWLLDKITSLDDKSTSNKIKNIEDYDKKLEESKTRVEDYAKRIWEIGRELKNLEKDRDISIAERVSKIDIELASEDDPAKRAKLEAERAEAFVWLTEEEIEALQLKIDAQKEYDALTEIGKIKADYEAKKAIAEQELLDLQNKLSEEEALFEAYTQAKEQMERDYTEQFKGMIEEQKSAVDGLISKYNELARAKSSAMGSGWSSTRTVVNNNQKTTTVNATVTSPTLVDYLVNKLSK